jgi:hypothetical protein
MISKNIKQSGRTIIELMVAIAISTFILLGISALYSTSSRSAKAATQLGALSEDTPIALHILGQSVKRSGYGEIIGIDFSSVDQTLFAFPHLRACRNGTFVNPSLGDFSCDTSGGLSTDSIALQFQADSIVSSLQRKTRNCLGADAVTAPITIDTHPGFGLDIPLVKNVYSVNGGVLTCAGNDATPETLASKIEEFRLYYGFDEAALNDTLANRTNLAPNAAQIVDADYVMGKDALFATRKGSAWDYVVSVHVCAVAATNEKGTSVQTNVNYSGCPDTADDAKNGIAPTRTKTDGTVRKTFNQVYTVRSHATGSPAIRTGP